MNEANENFASFSRVLVPLNKVLPGAFSMEYVDHETCQSIGVKMEICISVTLI